MSRLSTTNAAAAAGTSLAYAYFADFDFVSGHLRLTSWDSDITWGGNTYISIGKLQSVPDIAETTDLVPQALQYTLTATDPGAPPLSTTLTEKYHNRSALLYVGWLDQQTLQLKDTPQLLHEGVMDTMPLESGRNSSSVSLVVESRLILWNVASGWMYTDDHQRQFSPSDNFLNLVNTLTNKVAKWGPGAATNR